MYSLVKFYVVFLVLISGLFSCENREASQYRAPAIDRAPEEFQINEPKPTRKKMRRIFYRHSNWC